MGQMAYFPPLKHNPISSLARIQGASPTPKDRRERRAVAESHQTANDIAAFLSGFRPATFIGTDGHTYETESKRVQDSAAGRGPWSISFVGGGVNIAIPVNSFSVLSGQVQPPFIVNSKPVSYSDPTKNFLPVSSSTRYQSLEIKFTVDDTSPAALNTILVEILVGDPDAPRANTLGFRYVVLALLDMTLRISQVYFTPYRITTVRNGDRQSTENMFIY